MHAQQASPFSENIVHWCNTLLEIAGVGATVETVDDVVEICSRTSVFCAAAEAVTGMELHGKHRIPVTKTQRAENCDAAIQLLADQVLQTDLSHISGHRIADGSLRDIGNLLELLVAIFESLRPGSAGEAEAEEEEAAWPDTSTAGSLVVGAGSSSEDWVEEVEGGAVEMEHKGEGWRRGAEGGAFPDLEGMGAGFDELRDAEDRPLPQEPIAVPQPPWMQEEEPGGWAPRVSQLEAIQEDIREGLDSPSPQPPLWPEAEAEERSSDRRPQPPPHAAPPGPWRHPARVVSPPPQQAPPAEQAHSAHAEASRSGLAGADDASGAVEEAGQQQGTPASPSEPWRSAGGRRQRPAEPAQSSEAVPEGGRPRRRLRRRQSKGAAARPSVSAVRRTPPKRKARPPASALSRSTYAAVLSGMVEPEVPSPRKRGRRRRPTPRPSRTPPAAEAAASPRRASEHLDSRLAARLSHLLQLHQEAQGAAAHGRRAAAAEKLEESRRLRLLQRVWEKQQLAERRREEDRAARQAQLAQQRRRHDLKVDALRAQRWTEAMRSERQSQLHRELNLQQQQLKQAFMDAVEAEKENLLASKKDHRVRLQQMATGAAAPAEGVQLQRERQLLEERFRQLHRSLIQERQLRLLAQSETREVQRMVRREELARQQREVQERLQRISAAASSVAGIMPLASTTRQQRMVEHIRRVIHAPAS